VPPVSSKSPKQKLKPRTLSLIGPKERIDVALSTKKRIIMTSPKRLRSVESPGSTPENDSRAEKYRPGARRGSCAQAEVRREADGTLDQDVGPDVESR